MEMRRLETGISGLDTMLGNGFPEGRVILIAGGPGTGKTIFCSKFMHHGMTRQKQKALYISLDETRPHFLNEMRAFGWDFESLEKAGQFCFADATGVRRIPDKANVGRLRVEGGELGLVNLIDMIDSNVEKLGAQRVVLDSVSGLIFRFPRPSERRLALLEIIEALSASGATCLVTSELISTDKDRKISPEEYVSHGVVVLRTLPDGTRGVQILKMREANVDTTPRPYRITETGIEVYPDQSVYEPQ